MKHTKLYLYNGYALLCSYLVFRVVPVIPLWIQFYAVTNDSIDRTIVIFVTIVSALADGLNLFWFHKLLSGSLAFLKQLKKA